MQYILKQMHAQGHGAVVNTASVGGILGVGNQSGYAASKQGVVGLTRNSAREYGEKGIRINAIAPGAIMTAMVAKSLKQLDPENPEEAGKQFVSANPVERFGKPEEVAGLVSFLLSEDAGFINGTVVPVDGGQHAMYYIGESNRTVDCNEQPSRILPTAAPGSLAYPGAAYRADVCATTCLYMR